MTSKNKQQGFLSLDMAIGLLVFGVVVTLAMVWQIKQMDAQDYRIAADQQRTMSEAQAKYLKDNFNVVLANASATVPVQITVPMLINSNYLPAGFSSTNVFVIQGIRGGWQVALSNYSITPGPGHTASALFLMDGALANDYLYRNAVPNHPELNTMNTDLGMGNHNINNAGSISASGNVTTGADVTARNVTATANVNAATANVTGETYTGGWFRTRGDTGWYSEKWGGGIYQNSPDWVQVYNDKNFSTGGQLWGGKITSTGKITAYDRIATNEYVSVGGLATEGTACSDRTLIAKSAVGIILSCQKGVWTANNGWEFKLIQGSCQAPYKGSLTCTLGDTSWKSCSLTGALGVGDSEVGYIFRNDSGWFLNTSRLTWPGLFYWSCFK